MTKSIKLYIALFAVLGALTACSPNKPTDIGTDAEAQAAAEAAAEQARLDELEAARLAEQERLANVATTFYFEFDSSNLTDDARQALTIHAEILMEAPRSIRLEGHADERGTREYNMALGERRANAVRDFLVFQGVDASLIETISYGEEKPEVLGSSESSWAQNRRVELN